MITILQKVLRAIAIHGVMGTFKLCMNIIFRKLFWFTPAQRNQRLVRQESDRIFDDQWGSDTGGSFVPGKAEVIGPNWKYGIKYQGCNATALAEVLADLPIGEQKFHFIDLGCGKGRAILVAASFPFLKIVGVEYSTQLCQVARHNVSRFPKNNKKCDDIEIICADASAFQFPGGPLLIFLFNPFGRQVMSQVVKNVFAAYQQDPRRIIVVYFKPLFADLWKVSGFMEEVQRSQFFAVYDTVRGEQASNK